MKRCLLYPLLAALLCLWPPAIALPQPIDPNSGELCIDGRLQGPLNSSRSSFLLQAEVVETPDRSRAWLGAITAKTVETGPATQYIINGLPYSIVDCNDDGIHFFHVRVIGYDHGKGKPLFARVVIATRETPAQAFLFANFQTLPDPPAEDPPTPDIREWSQIVHANGHALTARIVSARLSTVSIKCGLAKNHVGSTEPLGDIAQRYGAIAAINGSFFDAYNDSPIKMPDEPLVSEGNLVQTSRTGTVLGFDQTGHWRMDRSAAVARMCGENSAMGQSDDPATFLFWSHVTEAVGCGPRLVVNGKTRIAPQAELISSSEVLQTRTIRSAVGITRDGRIILAVVDHANIPDLAAVMANLGCSDAMNLDGGASSGLWFRGHTIVSPGRDLSNSLLILPRR